MTNYKTIEVIRKNGSATIRFTPPMLVHDAKSRRGFAGGAVRAAEWVHGKRGFYEFKDIFKSLA